MEVKAPKNPLIPLPNGLDVRGLSDDELLALQDLPQWHGWKALVRAANNEATRVKKGLLDRNLDAEPSKMLRLLGEMEVLEKIVHTPARAAATIKRKNK